MYSAIVNYNKLSAIILLQTFVNFRSMMLSNIINISIFFIKRDINLVLYK